MLRTTARRLSLLSRCYVIHDEKAWTTTTRSFASLMDLIKDLRATSGAPIVDCKKALAQSNNDLQKSLDWLREHGAAKVSSKVGDRAAEEGLVGVQVSDDHKVASLVRVASETDFASRSSTFVDLVTYCAAATLQNPESGVLDPKRLAQAKHGSKTVAEAIKEAIVAIRENLSLAYGARLEAQEGGVVVGYVHGRVLPSQAGTAAAVLDLVPFDGNKCMDEETMLAVGKKLAMHIVAAKPQYKDVEAVPADVVENEREILTKQIGDSKKPPEIIQKIVDGRLRKFYETTCLMEQSHMIEEDNPKIGKYLEKLGLRLNNYYFISVA